MKRRILNYTELVFIIGEIYMDSMSSQNMVIQSIVLELCFFNKYFYTLFSYINNFDFSNFVFSLKQ